MSKPPFFLFVPGVLHTPAHFQPIISHLQTRYSLEASCVSLPNIGANASNARPLDDASAVRAALEHEIQTKGRDVVLVCHSYGGVPGCQAVKGLERSTRKAKGEEGGVIRVVFLNAFIVKDGESALDGIILTGQKAAEWLGGDPDDESIWKANELAGEFLFSDMPPSDRERWVEALEPISAHFLVTKVKGDCWGVEVRKSCITSSEDRVVWPETQRRMLERVRDGTWDEVREIGGGHAPFLSRVEELAGVLVEVGGE